MVIIVGLLSERNMSTDGGGNFAGWRKDGESQREVLSIIRGNNEVSDNDLGRWGGRRWKSCCREKVIIGRCFDQYCCDFLTEEEKCRDWVT